MNSYRSGLWVVLSATGVAILWYALLARKLCRTTIEHASATERAVPASYPSNYYKLDSNIALALKRQRKEPPFDKSSALKPNLNIKADGRVEVDIQASINADLMRALEAAGGSIINSFPAEHTMRALLPLRSVEIIASRDDVTFIAPADEPFVDSPLTIEKQPPNLF